MSAELLRRAAVKLREHAEAATGGPWSYHNEGEFCCIDGRADSPDAELVWSHYPEDVGIDLGDEDGQYIALMHPPVALALAEWLEFAANLRSGSGTVRFAGSVDYPVVIARAILREPGGGDVQ